MVNVLSGERNGGINLRISLVSQGDINDITEDLTTRFRIPLNESLLECFDFDTECMIKIEHFGHSMCQDSLLKFAKGKDRRVCTRAHGADGEADISLEAFTDGLLQNVGKGIPGSLDGDPIVGRHSRSRIGTVGRTVFKLRRVIRVVIGHNDPTTVVLVHGTGPSEGGGQERGNEDSEWG